MKKKRVPKKGLVYLLISDCGAYAKYGASVNLKARLSRINGDNPFKCKFIIKKFAYSTDIYHTENQIKYKFWQNHIGISEFFQIRKNDLSVDDAVDIFESTCLREGAICS